MEINGVIVNLIGVSDMSKDEIGAYIAMLTNEHGGIKPRKLIIGTNDAGQAVLDYELQVVPFERIRRITGYLVGGMERWNNAKRAEEHDRVKHGLSVKVKV